jgi:Trm5-related predicted tRNA methylase
MSWMLLKDLQCKDSAEAAFVLSDFVDVSRTTRCKAAEISRYLGSCKEENRHIFM